MGLTPEAWHVIGTAGEPAFQNGWLNWGSDHGATRFYKNPFGEVHLQGMLNCPSSALGTAIFALPAGYRPSVKLLFDAIANTAQARVDVTSNGTVFFVAGSDSAWLNLNGITFRAEQ